MTVTQGKKKKPPTFHYLPKSRAKRLKKSWVEDHKIRSKWKAQKRRDGLTNQTSAPVEDASNHDHDRTNTDAESHTSKSHSDKSLTPPPPDEQSLSLRDLRKIAYASQPTRTQKADTSHPKRATRHPHNSRGGKVTAGRGTCQPSMKLRMNVLLEKIKRDLS